MKIGSNIVNLDLKFKIIVAIDLIDLNFDKL